jgi:uncharacterized glyoxalase superfamily protein PhnB
MPDTPNIFPCLRYADAPAAIDWLERAFGCARHFVVPGENGSIAHAQLHCGAGMVMLGSRRPAAECDAMHQVLESGGTQVLYVVVADIDAHHARAAAAGAEIVVAPFDTDYGSRDYVARDPEGHVWCFGTYDPYAA